MLDRSAGQDGGSAKSVRTSAEMIELTQTLYQEFIARTQAVEVAAREWGIRPDYPEGVFVSAMLRTQSSFTEIVLSTAEALHAIVAKAHATAEEELARQRVVTAETKVALQNARAAIDSMETGGKGAIRRLEIEQEAVTAKLVDRIVPDMTKAVRAALVLRQHRYNHQVEWMRGLGIGGLMLLLVLTGYVWASWSDWGMAGRVEKIGAAIERCQLTSSWTDDKGKRLCEMSDFARI